MSVAIELDWLFSLTDDRLYDAYSLPWGPRVRSASSNLLKTQSFCDKISRNAQYTGRILASQLERKHRAWVEAEVHAADTRGWDEPSDQSPPMLFSFQIRDLLRPETTIASATCVCDPCWWRAIPFCHCSSPSAYLVRKLPCQHLLFND